MKFKGFIFDLDGVIVDTAHFHFIAWKRLAESLGVSFDAKDNEHLKGVSRKESLEWILKKGKLTIPNEVFEQKMEEKNQWYQDLVAGMTAKDILPGVIDFLNAADREGIKSAIASSSKNAPLILEKIELTERFLAIIDGNQITKGKPNPEVFLKAADTLQLAPKECVVFEDAQAGINGAVAGGFYAVGLSADSSLQKADLLLKSLENIHPKDIG